MNKNKLNYLSPMTETLVVRFEGNFCGTNNAIGQNGAQQSTVKNGSSYDFDDWGDLD